MSEYLKEKKLLWGEKEEAPSAWASKKDTA
jgi:hypothetical protein